MTEQTAIWLEKTIFWQRLLLLVLASFWIAGIVAGVNYLFEVQRKPTPLDLSPLMVFFLAWAAYFINKLHESIESTKAYYKSKEEILWQEALVSQCHFWKFLTLFLLLVGFVFLVSSMDLLIVYFN